VCEGFYSSGLVGFFKVEREAKKYGILEYIACLTKIGVYPGQEVTIGANQPTKGSTPFSHPTALLPEWEICRSI